MREIKFRGKSLSNGEWVYGFYTQGGFYDPDSSEMKVRHLIHCDVVVDVDHDTIGQFTGLHDKNGKEIFEGDIVIIPRVPEKRRNSVLTRHIVTSNSVCSWGFKSLTKEVLTLIISHTDSDSYRFEVIGNIWDNPDLNKTISLNLPERKPRKNKKQSLKVEFIFK